MGRVVALRVCSLLALLALGACDGAAPGGVEPGGSTQSGAGGAAGMAGGATTLLGGAVATLPGIEIPVDSTAEDLGAPCDPTRSVAPDGSGLIVRDPEVLARFSLERVLAFIAQGARVAVSPEELLARLFDTENTSADGVFTDVVHCDSPDNQAFAFWNAVDCPRAEGRLARSRGLLTPGHRDFFAPIALVNRFDLTPSDRSTCGEYRIVYAKQSGLTDPQDRVLLIFEAALSNPTGSLGACRAVASLWAGLSSMDPATRTARLSELYFNGVDSLPPVLSPGHLGGVSGDCLYTGRCGQIRVGQGMQAPFQFRQFRVVTSIHLEKANELFIVPTPDSQSLRPELFDLADPQASTGFARELASAVDDLAVAQVARMRARTHPAYDAGESAVGGAASPSFAARLAAAAPEASTLLLATLADSLVDANRSCPSDDPLTPDAIVQRVTALTCAGCHAPEQLLSAGAKLGCGASFPKSSGVTHIDERGRLSPALTEVFLPHRAQVLSTFLQACDVSQIEANLQPVPPVVRGECFPAGTPITLADGTRKPIEAFEPGDWVLSFDLPTRTLVPARVARRVLREDARRFVRINDALVATDNHPFFTENGWVRAEDLQIGAALASLEGPAVSLARVDSLQLGAQIGATYNLHVEGAHNYFAGGFLVHDRP